jgi:type VI protein secretion system component VasF
MSLDSIEQELLTTLRSVDAELRMVKHVQEEHAAAITQLTQRMQASINSLSSWVSDVQHAQRSATVLSMRLLWCLIALTVVALVVLLSFEVFLLWQNVVCR